MGGPLALRRAPWQAVRALLRGGGGGLGHRRPYVTLTAGGLGFEQRVAEARRARLEAVAGSAGPLPDYPELATDLGDLRELLGAVGRLHAEGEAAAGLQEVVAALPLLHDVVRGAGPALQRPGAPHGQAALALAYVSDVLCLLSGTPQYAELMEPDDAEELLEALAPLTQLGWAVPGLLPLAWQLMRKVTRQLDAVPEAVFYAANQNAAYRTLFRTHSMLDWCPAGERVAAEEFLHLSRKEVLFRQLAELDPCAIEAAGSLAHQCVFTQGVLASTAQEEKLVRMLVAHVTQKVQASTAGNPMDEVTAAEIAECVLKTAMYFPLLQAFPLQVVQVLAESVPYPVMFREPLRCLFDLQLGETREECNLQSHITGTAVSDQEATLRFAGLYSDAPADGSPWWRRSPALPAAAAGLGYHAAAGLFRPAEGAAASSSAPTSERVLLLGIGSGMPLARLAHPLLAAEAEVTAVDGSALNLAYARRQTAALWPATDRVRYVCADPLAFLGQPSLPEFHAVDCRGLLRHADDAATLLRGIATALTPGGVAVLGLTTAAVEEELASVRSFLRELSSGLPRPFLDSAEALLRPPTMAEVRVARRSLIAAAAHTPGRRAALRRPAFGTHTGFVDAFVRRPPHRRRLTDWAPLLHGAGLQVLGVELPANAQKYRALLAEGSGDPADLAAWEKLEAAHPDLFTEQGDACTVWCRRM